jgi:pimeloyl-ACP methyl ester carboxylesterase
MNDLSILVPDGGVTVQAIALMDLGLRTAVASLVTVSGAPMAVAMGSNRRERAAMEFYEELGAGADAASVFPPPPPAVPVRARRIGRPAWAPGVGHVDLLSFPSPYEARYPPMRERYASHTRNTTAWAQHWRHEDGPRPTILVVHGFAGSPYWLNSSFFALPWFYGHGCDVVLVTLPFHGPRSNRGAPYSGFGFFAHGMGHLAEAVMQSICDLRVIVDYLERSGVEHVGMTGLSLGGYMTALMAAVEPRLYVAIPNAAVTDLGRLIDGWAPAGPLFALARRRVGVDQAAYRATIGLHSPLKFPAVLPRERLFVIGGLGDRLAPPEQSVLLWEPWARPRIHWYPGGHILHLGRARYLREVGRFLRETGFSPG